MNKLVFEFSSYKSFLRHITEETKHSWGIKSKLSAYIGCQATYLSQVIKDKADLNSEQIFRVCLYLDFNEEEKNYLMLLHQKERASTKELKEYYNNQIKNISNKRLNLVSRLGGDNQLNEQEKAIYYSSWLYMAIHFAVDIDKLKTRDELKKKFKLNSDKLNTIINFLLEKNLIIEDNGKLKRGVQFIRLGNDSSWITSHHTNWRNKAIQNFEHEDLLDFHYSGIYTLSESDALKIKNLYLDSIKKNIEIVKESNEEKLYVLNIDFFNLLK